MRTIFRSSGPTRAESVNTFLGEEAVTLLESCPNKDAGCFAAQPESLADVRHGLMDAAIRKRGQNAVIACIEAGKEGTPLEDVTFNNVAIVPVGSSSTHVTVIDTDEILSVSIYSQSIKCAYVCGSLAVSCPMLQE